MASIVAILQDRRAVKLWASDERPSSIAEREHTVCLAAEPDAPDRSEVVGPIHVPYTRGAEDGTTLHRGGEANRHAREVIARIVSAGPGGQIRGDARGEDCPVAVGAGTACETEVEAPADVAQAR